MGGNHSSGPVEAVSVLQACPLSRSAPAGLATDEPRVSVRLIVN